MHFISDLNPRPSGAKRAALPPSPPYPGARQLCRAEFLVFSKFQDTDLFRKHSIRMGTANSLLIEKMYGLIGK